MSEGVSFPATCEQERIIYSDRDDAIKKLKELFGRPKTEEPIFLLIDNLSPAAYRVRLTAKEKGLIINLPMGERGYLKVPIEYVCKEDGGLADH
jgi:hypothetical protein